MTLVGTMHVGITTEDMDPKLWQRIQAADTVIIETDIGNSDPEVMQRYMLLPTGQQLRAQLEPKYWTQFLGILKAAGSKTPAAQLNTISPLAAGILLLQSQAQNKEDMKDGQLSIDQIIFEKARDAGKKTKTFETNDEQLGYLKKVFTIAMLQKMMDEWAEESSSYDVMKSAFKNGDSAALDAILEELPKEIRASLLDARNMNWIGVLPKLKSPSNTLIAVGAAHYAGPQGLIRLLEQQGYTIRPL